VYRPSKARNLSYNVLAHNLRLTRFVCSALVLCQTNPQVRLADVRMCYDLARELRKAALASNGHPPPVLVVPDAWLHFELLDAATGAHTSSVLIWLEIDNATMYRLRFQQHVEDRIEYIRSGNYANFFREGAVRIAYAAIGSRDEHRDRRLSAMCTWTKELLIDLDLEDWSDVLYLTSLVYEDLFTLKHFTEPRWYTVTDPKPRRLLDP
jgi:hypothetical protein